MSCRNTSRLRAGGRSSHRSSRQTRKSERTSSRTEREAIHLNKGEWSHLLAQDWYHGMMPRDEIEDLLVNDGDFLVRKSDVNDKVLLPLSVRYGGKIRHFVLKYNRGQWWIIDRKARKKSLDDLLEHYIKSGTPLIHNGPILKQTVSRPSYYILHEQIELRHKLGEGAFGEVWSGKLKEFGIEIDCAVKTFKGAMAKQKRVDFVREARLMRKFSHPNIVRVYGVAPQKEPIMIILELSPGGSLKSYMHKAPVEDVTPLTMGKFSRDAADGMNYLSRQRVIHRDIAARNCLLGCRNEVKISDFGLSVELAEDKTSLRASENIKLPVRWLAPETIRLQEFSFKTDVWSFGVLMWEIFSRCSSDPYPGMTLQEVLKMVTTSMQSIEPPEEMPEAYRYIMLDCFIREPETRPTFEELLYMLKTAIADMESGH